MRSADQQSKFQSKGLRRRKSHPIPDCDPFLLVAKVPSSPVVYQVAGLPERCRVQALHS